MEHIAREFLPKERHVREIQKESREIKTVSDYIDRVDRYILARGGENSVVVYRGEPKIYPFPCRPNIFRKGVMEGNPIVGQLSRQIFMPFIMNLVNVCSSHEHTIPFIA